MGTFETPDVDETMVDDVTPNVDETSEGSASEGSASEGSASRTRTGDYDIPQFTAASPNDRASADAKSRPKVLLAVGVTCPDCGHTSKLEWMGRSHQGGAFATTVFCGQCGCLMTIWAGHVDARVIAHKQDY
jgi:hypothetical protein